MRGDSMYGEILSVVNVVQFGVHERQLENIDYRDSKLRGNVSFDSHGSNYD